MLDGKVQIRLLMSCHRAMGNGTWPLDKGRRSRLGHQLTLMWQCRQRKWATRQMSLPHFCQSQVSFANLFYFSPAVRMHFIFISCRFEVVSVTKPTTCTSQEMIKSLKSIWFFIFFFLRRSRGTWPTLTFSGAACSWEILAKCTNRFSRVINKKAKWTPSLCHSGARHGAYF